MTYLLPRLDCRHESSGCEWTAPRNAALLAYAGWSQHLVHRARQPLGERLLQILQREATRRAAQWRNLLQLEGGSGSHRAMAKALQHDQATLFARIPTTGATDDEPVPDTARSDRANAIVSPSRWYRKSVRPVVPRVRQPLSQLVASMANSGLAAMLGLTSRPLRVL